MTRRRPLVPVAALALLASAAQAHAQLPVSSHDAAGNVVWTRQFGTGSTDEAFGLSVDSSGVYVVGSTAGTLPGQTSAGLADAKMSAQLSNLGAIAMPMKPAEFGRFITDEIEKWAKVIKFAGIKPG